MKNEKRKKKEGKGPALVCFAHRLPVVVCDACNSICN